MQIELINQNMSAAFNCNNCVPMRPHMVITEIYIYIYIYLYIYIYMSMVKKLFQSKTQKYT